MALELVDRIRNGKMDETISRVYPGKEICQVRRRLAGICQGYEKLFGITGELHGFSVPGRTELGGNHTDHQHGCVLAAGVDLDSAAAAAPNGEDTIRLFSEGYGMLEVDIREIQPRREEQNTTAALIRGVVAYLREQGHQIGGFHAYVSSEVLPGSGLSSSASFEVLIGIICSGLFAKGQLSPALLAQAGQYAENRYFGKPCGLMDQMACAMGGVIFLDFTDSQNPYTRKIPFDLRQAGYDLCILDCGAGHEGLTGEYASIVQEMNAVAACFHKEYLREVDEKKFFSALKQVRETAGDRAALRAIHFFRENRRVPMEAEALKVGDFHRFLSLVGESGRSSYMYLQNIVPRGAVEHQEMGIALALCEELLCGKGAFRVHGGGFAGTVQAFVPHSMLSHFRQSAEEVLGSGSCLVLSLRHAGAIQLW